MLRVPSKIPNLFPSLRWTPHRGNHAAFQLWFKHPKISSDQVYSPKRWLGNLGRGGFVTQSLQVTRCQALFLSPPRISPVTLRKGASGQWEQGKLCWHPMAAGSGCFLSPIQGTVRESSFPCQSPRRICTSLAFASLQGHPNIPGWASNT